MHLFDRPWKNATACINHQSSPVRSEIGHNALRRYYWVCSSCGAKVYIEDWKGNTEVLWRAPRYRAITRLHNANAL